MRIEEGERTPPVSVIIPVRNEQEHLDRCLESVVSLDYPRDRIEIMLVDGMSTDDTVRIIESWIEKDSRIRVLVNPKRAVSAGMNAGLRESRYDLILWMSGHAVLPPNYLRRCVETMSETTAAAVGGTLHTVASSSIGRINAFVLSNRFGVGGSACRVGRRPGWVPIVTMALYRKDAVLRAGGWDESLPRNQDNDLHNRMNQEGERSYLITDSSPLYLCRETFSGLLRQAWKNGYWNVMLTRMGRGGLQLRHFAPMLFVGCLLFLGIASLVFPPAFYLLAGILAIYGAAASAVSLIGGIRSRFTWQMPLLPFWFLSLHLCYGLASWAALISPKFKPKG